MCIWRNIYLSCHLDKQLKHYIARIGDYQSKIRFKNTFFCAMVIFNLNTLLVSVDCLINSLHVVHPISDYLQLSTHAINLKICKYIFSFVIQQVYFFSSPVSSSLSPKIFTSFCLDSVYLCCVFFKIIVLISFFLSRANVTAPGAIPLVALPKPIVPELPCTLMGSTIASEFLPSPCPAFHPNFESILNPLFVTGIDSSTDAVAVFSLGFELPTVSLLCSARSLYPGSFLASEYSEIIIRIKG